MFLPVALLILVCDGIEVELAHLLRGSIVVQAGDRLDIGDRIGRVGNSGDTTEPHLHIHAVEPRTRLAVPITFDGRNSVPNTLFERRQRRSHAGHLKQPAWAPTRRATG